MNFKLKGDYFIAILDSAVAVLVGAGVESLRLNMLLMSSKIKYKEGTNSSVMTVANKIPKASDIAIGITICACRLRSNTIGIKPMKVVSDVKMIARKRWVPALIAASTKRCPSLLARLTKSTIIKLSFTTTPLNAIIPQIESTLTALPSSKWPMIAPTMPKGITDIMINGCE